LASDPVQADFAAALDAALPEAKRTLRHRPRSALPMDPSVVPDDAILLLDTTVYIDGVKRVGLPPGIEALLANHIVCHSPLCVGELAFGFGRLDPAHPETARNRAAITAMLQRLSGERMVDPSPAGWAKAGVLAGSLARTQGFALDRRRALFIDAALFVTAQETGLTLVSGNLSDMDLLLQVGGSASVLLYMVQ
jgi:hypothetical protein